MNGKQKFLSILAGLAIAALALPASAATKSITMTVPSDPLTSSTTEITVKINNTGNSNANSFEVDWNSANFSVTGGCVGANPCIPGNLINPGVSQAPYKGIVWNQQAPFKAGTSVTITLQVQVTQACPSTAVTWKAATWAGAPGPLSQSYPLNGGPYSTPIAVGAGSCGNLSIDAPASAVVNTAFNVTVNLSAPAPAGGADVTLGSSCSYTGAGTQHASAGGNSVAFSGSTSLTGTCTFNATDPSGGYTSASASVYVGTLGCNEATNPTFPPVAGPGYFASLPTGVSSVTQTGFFAGYHIKDPAKPACDAAAISTTANNLTGSDPEDVGGITLPANAAWVGWQSGTTNGALFVYMLTYQAEWVGADGLPEKKTKFCDLSGGNTDCTQAGKQVTLQACNDPELSAESIPDGDPACLVSQTWTTAPAAACAGLDNPNGVTQCVRATDTILDGIDPPIVRN